MTAQATVSWVLQEASHRAGPRNLLCLRLRHRRESV